MEQPSRKKWDPNCPKCRAELQRYYELAEGIVDDVDHGAGVYWKPAEDFHCDHESVETCQVSET